MLANVKQTAQKAGLAILVLISIDAMGGWLADHVGFTSCQNLQKQVDAAVTATKSNNTVIVETNSSVTMQSAGVNPDETIDEDTNGNTYSYIPNAKTGAAIKITQIIKGNRRYDDHPACYRRYNGNSKCSLLIMPDTYKGVGWLDHTYVDIEVEREGRSDPLIWLTSRFWATIIILCAQYKIPKMIRASIEQEMQEKAEESEQVVVGGEENENGHNVWKWLGFGSEANKEKSN